MTPPQPEARPQRARGGRRPAPPPAQGPRVALLSKRGKFRVAEPFFEPGPEIALERGGKGAQSGGIALVEFVAGRARFLKPLGSPKCASDVVEALLRDRGLQRGFEPRVDEEARAAAAGKAHGSRRDLTELSTFTVDPPSARDFDDAISAEAEGDAIRLWVHIADVSAHVRPGSSLDKEAYARATSTYVPGTVEPMLPAALSTDACSLVPGVPRPAVTAEIVLGPDGRARSSRFYRSMIRSDARLDYDEVDAVFAGRATVPEAIGDPLALARRAATLLAGRRGPSALTVDGREPEFEFDTDGNVIGARLLEQTESHRLIEHLMILANEQVAELLERRRVPALYRVHEHPDPMRMEFLTEQLADLEVPTPPLPAQMTPRQAGVLAGEASRMVKQESDRRGHGGEAYVTLILRSLKQAYYSDRNLGHAGLDSTAYAHFTSPIRRYPDLVVHRALLSVLGEGEATPARDSVHEAGWHSSTREREAMRIERDADSICASFLLERALFERGWDEPFEGEVVGLVGAGAFVRFGTAGAATFEGFLPAREIPGERFDLNETETALVGRRTRTRVRLGDPVTVRVERVTAQRGRVDLAPVIEGSTRRPPKPQQQRAGGKGGRSRGGRR